VILCRRGNAEAALHRLREIMGKLKLTVNEDKTHRLAIGRMLFWFLEPVGKYPRPPLTLLFKARRGADLSFLFNDDF
jgi:hypothetical protein